MTTQSLLINVTRALDLRLTQMKTLSEFLFGIDCSEALKFWPLKNEQDIMQSKMLKCPVFSNVKHYSNAFYLL